MRWNKNGLNKTFLNYIIAYLTNDIDKLIPIIKASGVKIDKFNIRQKYGIYFHLIFSSIEHFEQSPIGLLFGLNSLNSNPTLGNVIIDIALYLNGVDHKYEYFYNSDWNSILNMINCDNKLRLNKKNFIYVIKRIINELK